MYHIIPAWFICAQCVYTVCCVHVHVATHDVFTVSDIVAARYLPEDLGLPACDRRLVHNDLGPALHPPAGKQQL